MSDTHLNGAKSNGSSGAEVKTPFLIGVAGGTASGKVNIVFVKKNVFSSSIINTPFD